MNDKNKHIKTGFQTPKDYFDTLENNLLEELQIQPKSGYTLPEHYFDTLENKILEKTTTQKTTVRRLISKKHITYISTIAATLVFSFFVLRPSDVQHVTFNDIDYSTYEDYLTTEELNISPEELTELYDLNTSDLEGISFSTLEDDIITEYLSNTIEAETYLDNDL